MVNRLAADAVLVLHLLFVGFVCLGGLLVLRWPRVAWVHIPAAVWGALVELTGWICPLTPLEDWLREGSAVRSHSLGFIERHVTFLLYPEGLTRRFQIALGIGVLLFNFGVYGFALARHKRKTVPS